MRIDQRQEARAEYEAALKELERAELRVEVARERLNALRPWWKRKRYMLGLATGLGAIGLVAISALGDTGDDVNSGDVGSSTSPPTRAVGGIVGSPTVSATSTPVSAVATEAPPVTPEATNTVEPPRAAATVVRPSAPLLIESFNCVRDSRIGYVYGRGEVRNQGTKALENVVAVVTWYTSTDDFVVSDDALIEFDPLLPGQSSPYEVISRFNPAMEKCSIRFKELLGGQIPASRPTE